MPIIRPSDYTDGKPGNYYAYAVYSPVNINLSGHDIWKVFSNSTMWIATSADFMSAGEFIILEHSRSDKHILIDGKSAEPISDYKLWNTLALAKKNKIITDKRFRRAMSQALYSFALYIYAIGHKTKKMLKQEDLDKLLSERYDLERQLENVNREIRKRCDK